MVSLLQRLRVACFDWNLRIQILGHHLSMAKLVEMLGLGTEGSIGAQTHFLCAPGVHCIAPMLLLPVHSELPRLRLCVPQEPLADVRAQRQLLHLVLHQQALHSCRTQVLAYGAVSRSLA
jgi:hypothetical protein